MTTLGSEAIVDASPKSDLSDVGEEGSGFFLDDVRFERLSVELGASGGSGFRFEAVRVRGFADVAGGEGTEEGDLTVFAFTTIRFDRRD